MLGSHWTDDKSVRITAIDRVSVHLKAFEEWLNDNVSEVDNDDYDGESA